MVQNSKNITAMRKFITSILIAAAAMTACVQNDDFVVNNTNDTITLTAHITAPEARTVLVDDGDDVYHAEWAVGDKVDIYEVTETGGTRAKSTTNLKNGIEITVAGKTTTITETYKVLDADKFYYVLGSQCMSMNDIATTIAFTLPSSQAPQAMNALDVDADILVSQMVESTTQPTAAITYNTTRLSSIAKVSIKVPTALAADDAVTGVIFTCAENIAGKYSLKWDSVKAADHFTNATFSAGQKAISVTLPEAQTNDFSFYMGLWPRTLAQGSKVTVSVMTEKGKEFVKDITLPSAMEFAQGDMTGFTVNMSSVPEYIEQTYEPIEGTVNVAGIYWALGNLEYEVDGTTSEGFAAGWRIAPTQYHHFYIGAAENLTNIGNYNKVAHFNFGGIEDSFTTAKASAISKATSDPAFDFSGKMYTDQTCTTVTTNYAEAKYGDIAFWASKGKYRMPSKDDMEQLWTKACRTLATYYYGKDTEGKDIIIKGTYFYNPAKGELPGVVSGTKEVTDNDLKVGLFLPWSGRAYNGTEYSIYKINSQAVYRTSTVNSTSTEEDTNGVIYRIQSLTEGAYYHASYGATARYAIRPIYIVAE